MKVFSGRFGKPNKIGGFTPLYFFGILCYITIMQNKTASAFTSSAPKLPGIEYKVVFKGYKMKTTFYVELSYLSDSYDDAYKSVTEMHPDLMILSSTYEAQDCL